MIYESVELRIIMEHLFAGYYRMRSEVSIWSRIMRTDLRPFAYSVTTGSVPVGDSKSYSRMLLYSAAQRCALAINLKVGISDHSLNGH
jgi:hypothetical protein